MFSQITTTVISFKNTEDKQLSSMFIKNMSIHIICITYSEVVNEFISITAVKYSYSAMR